MHNVKVLRWSLILVAFVALTGCTESESLSLVEQAEEAFDRGELQRARELSNEALQLNPEDHQAYLVRGRIWIEEDNVQLAIEDYSRAIRLRPTDPQPYYFRADAYDLQGKDDEARADRHEAHRKDPVYKRAFIFDQDQLAAEMNISRRLAEESAQENVDAVDAADEAERDPGDSSDPLYDPFLEHSENANGSPLKLNDRWKSRPDLADDETPKRRSKIDEFRENQTRVDDWRDRLPLSDDSRLESIRPEVPSARNEFQSWKEGLMSFEQSQELGFSSNLSGELDESDRTEEPTEILPDRDGKTTEPLRKPNISPFRRTWKLSGGLSDPLPSAPSVGFLPGRPGTQIPSTGLNSMGLNSTPTLPQAGWRATATNRMMPNPSRWPRFSRRTPSANMPSATPSQAQIKTFRRGYLLPQAGAVNGIQQSPRTTGIRGAAIP